MKKEPLDLLAPPGEDETVYDNLQLTRLLSFIRDGFRSFRTIAMVAVALLTAAFIVFVVVTAKGGTRIENLTEANKDTIEANRKLAVGGVVATCALNRVTIGLVHDAFVTLHDAGFRAPTPEATDNAYDTIFKALNDAVFDCKVLAPEKDRLNVTLDYPTTIPTPP